MRENNKTKITLFKDCTHSLTTSAARKHMGSSYLILHTGTCSILTMVNIGLRHMAVLEYMWLNTTPSNVTFGHVGTDLLGWPIVISNTYNSEFLLNGTERWGQYSTGQAIMSFCWQKGHIYNNTISDIKLTNTDE